MPVRLIAALLVAAVAAPAASAASDGVGAVFRIAVPAEAAAPPDSTGDCAGAEGLSGGARAYALHMSDRFRTRAELCFLAPETAAARLAAGGIDMAWLTPAAASIVPDHAALLTLRRPSGVGRVPVQAVVADADSGTPLKRFDGARAALYDDSPPDLHRDLVLQTLADVGVAPGETVAYATLEEIVDALRNGAVSIALLDASSIVRHCTPIAGAPDACAGVTPIWQGRAQARGAFATQRAITTALRYRLIGVHIALHLEAPDAFAWLSGGRGPDFEPAEADALKPRLADGA